MKKHLILGVVIASVALLLTACGGNSHIQKATSDRLDLEKTVRSNPSLATLEVRPTRVTATAYANELEGLKLDEQRQAVVAKALATVNGDVMIAPQFTVAKGADGKMTSMTVAGYAALIQSFRPMTVADVEYDPDLIEKTKQATPERKVVNTMTVADVEFSEKKSTSLTPVELVNKNEAQALKLAKEKLLRQEKADVLYHETYNVTLDGGKVSAFTLTAFTGKYVNYRKPTKLQQLVLKPSVVPNVTFRPIAADIKTVAPRCQLKFGTGNTQAKESELKETARAAALKKYNADFLLNETFYFDYQEKVITHVTICGTPAVYANFRPMVEDEVVDVKLVPFHGPAAKEETPLGGGGFLDFFKNLFKKK